MLFCHIGMGNLMGRFKELQILEENLLETKTGLSLV